MKTTRTSTTKTTRLVLSASLLIAGLIAGCSGEPDPVPDDSVDSLPTVSLPLSSASGPIVINKLTLNGSGSLLRYVAPGQKLTAVVDYKITQVSTCPGCIDQILIGLAPGAPGLDPTAAVGCVYNGIPSLNGTTGSGAVTFTAPRTPGIYYVRYRLAQDTKCNLGWWTVDFTPDSSSTIGAFLVVR